MWFNELLITKLPLLDVFFWHQEEMSLKMYIMAELIVFLMQVIKLKCICTDRHLGSTELTLRKIHLKKFENLAFWIDLG